MKPATLDIARLRDLVRRLPNDSLMPIREAALTRLDAHGLPTPRDEDWKYTDLAPLVDISNRWLRAGGKSPSSAARQETLDAITGGIDATWIVIANGVAEAPQTPDSELQGLQVSRVSDAPSPLALQHPLADLNAALRQDGLRIRITGRLKKPVGILLADNAGTDIGVAQSSVEIQLEPGTCAELIEYHVSDGDQDHYANSILTISVGDDADLRHVRIQNRSLGHTQTGRTSVSLGRDARLRMASYDLGGRLIRNDIDIDISHAGADVSFDGLYLAGDGQHIDNHTRVDHRTGPATSAQEYRGILNGRCRCVWNGKAIVHKGADGTDAQQANHNLLLSEKAEIDAKPELEIYADDVKCSHGTTVGQLDESALFYLRSRGLDKKHAIRVLTHAFASDLVRRAPIDATTDAISTIVETRLAELIEADIVAELLS